MAEPEIKPKTAGRRRPPKPTGQGRQSGKRDRRRSWGTVEALPSGRFRARVPRPGGGGYVAAPITFESRTDAEIYLDTQRADMVRRVWQAPRDVRDTVGEYVGKWIEQHPTAKESTKDLYRQLFTKCIEEDLGDIPLTELRPDLVRDWHHRLGARLERQAAERRRRMVQAGRTPSSASVRDGRTRQAQAYRLLRAALYTAVTDDLIREQPCRVAGAGKPKVSAERAERDLAERLLTGRQVAQVAAKMPARYRALVLAAAWSGLRQGELLALKRSDLDLRVDAPVVRVRRRARRLSTWELDIDTPKSGASMRTVSLPALLAAALRLHLDRFVEDAPEALVFATRNGTIPGGANIGQSLRRAMTKAGVRQVRFHDLRHVAQVLAAESGATLAELMARMGHATADAAQIYMHARRDRDALLAERLNAVMVPIEVDNDSDGATPLAAERPGGQRTRKGRSGRKGQDRGSGKPSGKSAGKHGRQEPEAKAS